MAENIPGSKIEQPEIPFPSRDALRHWLESNHALSNGIWLKMYKKGSGVPSVVYAEALEEALCFGWIDGQLKAGDALYYLQRFTPRRPRSTWSKRNIALVERLDREGKITASGWLAIEKAKADGRWDNAYDSAGSFSVPEDLLSHLAQEPKSKAFFESLNKINQYAIVWRLQSAPKPEIREKRMKAILQMLAKGEKIHP